jgi:hypothetical protein
MNVALWLMTGTLAVMAFSAAQAWPKRDYERRSFVEQLADMK